MPTRILGGVILLACVAVHAADNPTFHRDVAPLLQKRCQSCHRPGEAAPMPFLTYGQTRPWAKAIRQAVLSKKMPPWFADPAVGHFTNDRTLAREEIDALVKWADSGAPEGDAKDAPKPLQFTDGWTIGTPDAVFEMPQPFDVPATGIVDYQWIRMETGFTENKWIQALEFRPGERAVVHHIVGVLRYRNSAWMMNAPVGVPIRKDPKSAETGMSNAYLGDYVPGMPGIVFPEGSAMLLPAGADILFQVHYTPNGKACKDRSKVGLVFAKEPPKNRILNVLLANGRFRIPPRDPAYRVDATMAFSRPVTLLAFNAHMHLRGKSMEARAVYSDGRIEELLRIPRYDFNWQLTYELGGKLLPAGTRLEATAYFDNSVNNPSNPNPNAEVGFGDQTSDEMMVLFTHIMFPAETDIRQLFLRADANPGAYPATPERSSQFAAALPSGVTMPAETSERNRQ